MPAFKKIVYRASQRVLCGGIQRGDWFRRFAPNPLFPGEPAGVAGVGGTPSRCAFPLGGIGKGGCL